MKTSELMMHKAWGFFRCIKLIPTYLQIHIRRYGGFQECWIWIPIEVSHHS
jgi:hypothetical protein